MAQEVTIRVTAEDLASGKLNEISGDVAKVGDSVEKQGDASDKAAEQSGFLSQKLGDLNVASLAAAVGIDQLAGFLSTGVQDFVQMERATARYEFAMKQAGATTADLNDAQTMMRSNFNRTGFSISQQEEALARLARKTGDQKTAQTALGDAMDLAAATGQDLSDVSKDLAEAMTGDINALEQMGILTEESTDELREMDSASRRAAAAMEILRDKVGGASGEMDDQVVQVQKLKEGYKEVRAESGRFGVTFAENLATIVTVGKAAEDNESSLMGVADALSEATDKTATYTGALQDMFEGKKGQQLSDDALRFAAGVNELGGRKERAAKFTRQLIGVTKEETAAQEALSEAIETYGLESKEAERAAHRYRQALEGTKGAVDALADSLADRLNQQMSKFSGIADKARETIENTDFGALSESVLGQDVTREPEDEQEQADQRRTAIARKRVQLLKEEDAITQARLKKELRILQIDRESMNRAEIYAERLAAQKEAEGEIAKIKERRAKAAREELEVEREKTAEATNAIVAEIGISEQEQARNDMARQKINILREEDELKQAGLQRDLQLMQLARQDLTRDERKLEQLRIQEEHEQRILEIKEKQTDESAKGADKTAEGMKEFADAAQQSGSSVTSSMGEVVGIFQAIEEGEGAATDALGSAGGAAKNMASELGASAAAQAGIMAIFETAMGFATLSNPAISAGHFIAAANFGVIAGTKATEGGGSKGGGDSKGNGLGGGVSQSPERAAEESTRMLVEALSQTERMEGQSMTIINDFSGATLLESQPATQNRISDAVERGRQRTVSVGGRS